MTINLIELKKAFEKVKNFTNKKHNVLSHIVIEGQGDFANVIACNNEVSISTIMWLEEPSNEMFILEPFLLPVEGEVVNIVEESEYTLLVVDGVNCYLKKFEGTYPLKQLKDAAIPHDVRGVNLSPKYLIEVAKACKKDNFITFYVGVEGRPMIYQSSKGTTGVICPIKVNR